MDRITIDLPIVKVNVEDNWYGCDYGKEHYERGLFVIDDGINRHFGMWDGLSLWNCPMPHDLIDKYIVERAIGANDEIYHRDMEAIEERLSQIARLLGETKDEVVKGEARLMDVIVEEGKVRDSEFDTLRDGLEALECSRGGGDMCGVNILDVAKSFAVIQKPELIKELNK